MKYLVLINSLFLLTACHDVDPKAFKQDEICRSMTKNYLFVNGIDNFHLSTVDDTKFLSQHLISYHYQPRKSSMDNPVTSRLQTMQVDCKYQQKQLNIDFSYPNTTIKPDHLQFEGI
ncbi:hypothetical protein [Acinetobacter populi]|uniref:Lipoprotein n=1 Tax=Acinetobacter populi TaxID=1582270 RepID=A0A1Z9YYS2_9GAMM|nr:hypothetical protein [Acinetobacter populi]OUY07370.1 hypothetical protein CAP51_06285 [Acinetobacter populi]